jgi:hypothetical protein
MMTMTMIVINEGEEDDTEDDDDGEDDGEDDNAPHDDFD